MINQLRCFINRNKYYNPINTNNLITKTKPEQDLISKQIRKLLYSSIGKSLWCRINQRITVTSTKTTIMIGLQHNLKNGKVKSTYHNLQMAFISLRKKGYWVRFGTLNFIWKSTKTNLMSKTAEKVLLNCYQKSDYIVFKRVSNANNMIFQENLSPQLKLWSTVNSF